MKYLVVLWDMDGVLVDSEPLHIAKLIKTCAAYGVELTPQHFTTPQSFSIPDADGNMVPKVMPLGGAGDKNIYHWLMEQKPELAEKLPMNKWLGELLDYYVAHAHTLKPRDGMVNLVDHFHATDVIQAVVTSGIPKQVEANLSALGDAAKHMAFALNADDVKQSKPNPEGYLIAMARVIEIAKQRGIDPADLVFVAVEDSEPGTKAALAAGISCVQYLLPGAKPMDVAQEQRSRFLVAKTGHSVGRCIETFLSRAGFGPSTRPKLRNKFRKVEKPTPKG